MANEIRSQGTEVFVVDPAATGAEIIKLGNITTVGEYGKLAPDIVTTNLDSLAVEKISGLADNGDFPVTLNVAEGDAGHEFLEDKAGTATRYQIIVADSTGVAPPTFSAGSAVMPTDRTVRHFLASIKSFRIQGISPDSVVAAQVNFGISGAITVARKP